MKVNPELRNQLDQTFPESLNEEVQLSDIERKVSDYTERLLMKSCQYIDAARVASSYVKGLYQAAWIPYRMLKHPLAYRNKLAENSKEKNLEVLVNIDPANVAKSVMTPEIARLVPWVSVSAESVSAISKYLSFASLLGPFVHAPAYHSVQCIKAGRGYQNLDFRQFQSDLGRCFTISAKVYQGPEVLGGAALSFALGALTASVTYPLFYLLFHDNDGKERYEKLDKIYTDAAMLLKAEWDDAVKSGDENAIKKCTEKAIKLKTNLGMISGALVVYADLTGTQANAIGTKLNWGINYVLKSREAPKPESSDELLANSLKNLFKQSGAI